MVSIRPKHLKRYQTVVWMLIKHGRSEMVHKSGLADLIDSYDEVTGRTNQERAEELARDLEAHGPTFVKLGQLLSTRTDLLPHEYIEALTRLQDRVKPQEFSVTKREIERSLGRSIEQCFQSIETEPFASASLSQVYKAVSREGQNIAVKVRREGIRDVIVDDLDAFEDLATLFEEHTEVGRVFGLRQIVATFRVALINELDFRSESEALERLNHALADFNQIRVPKTYPDLCSESVLTMEYIDGIKISASNWGPDQKQLGKTLAHELFRSYLYQIFVAGFFHADPHPGNLLFTSLGRIAILDLGLVIYLTPRKQDQLAKLLLALSEGLGELVADITVSMGYPLKDFNYEKYRDEVASLVARNYSSSLDKVNMGHLILELNLLAGQNRFRLASEIIALSKVLLNLDKSLAVLDPKFSLSQAVSQEAAHLLKHRLSADASVANFYSTLSESKEFAMHFPFRFNRILSNLANNNLRFKVDALDEKHLIEGIQKIANRITAGLLLGSLILGASIVMHIKTDVTLLGYPVIAFVLFVLAAVGAAVLAFNILFRDE